MFTGLLPAMVAPFDERGEIDLTATESLVARFVEAGVDGISPLGSTGESSHLTNDERKRFAEEMTRNPPAPQITAFLFSSNILVFLALGLP